jgi:hypothetical protein
MTGPRPAGRLWTLAEEAQLHVLVASGVTVGLIARKLKRSPGAVYARVSSLKKSRATYRSGRNPVRCLPSVSHTHIRPLREATSKTVPRPLQPWLVEIAERSHPTGLKPAAVGGVISAQTHPRRFWSGTEESR